jgi:hypothetical protein
LIWFLVLNATFSSISAISWRPVLVNIKSIVLYNIRLHIPCSYFTFKLGFFHFLLLAVASDKAYQLLAHGRWFSPASSTTKTGNMNMQCKVVCYIGLLTLCCSHANVHVDYRDLLTAFRYQ